MAEKQYGVRGMRNWDPEYVEPFLNEGNARFYAHNGDGTVLVVSDDGGHTWREADDG